MVIMSIRTAALQTDESVQSSLRPKPAVQLLGSSTSITTKPRIAPVSAQRGQNEGHNYIGHKYMAMSI